MNKWLRFDTRKMVLPKVGEITNGFALEQRRVRSIRR